MKAGGQPALVSQAGLGEGKRGGRALQGAVSTLSNRGEGRFVARHLCPGGVSSRWTAKGGGRWQGESGQAMEWKGGCHCRQPLGEACPGDKQIICECARTALGKKISKVRGDPCPGQASRRASRKEWARRVLDDDGGFEASKKRG